MTINGANLREASVNFNKLSNIHWTNDKRISEIINYLEKLYVSIQQEANQQSINQMKVEDGKVIIEEHALNHRCSSSIDSLKMISMYGVLASEWFGILESEREGCFCAFVSRMKGEKYPTHGDLAEDDKSRLNIGKNVILFFDDKNQILKYLLHLDYFEFEHQKQVNPQYKQLYTPDELKILEELIEPISPAGKYMRCDHDFKTNYWSAIPGGIPSQFINGICIKKNKYSEEELNELNLLFPNAVIFNSLREVIRYPIINQVTEQHNKRI